MNKTTKTKLIPQCWVCWSRNIQIPGNLPLLGRWAVGYGVDRLDICHKLVHHLNHHHIHDHQNIVDDQQNDVDDHQNDVYDDQNDVDDHHGLNEKCNKPVSAAERG